MTWEEKFIANALLIASWSKHPTTKVGCIIVDADHNQLSSGYNGLPRGVDDAKILDQSKPYSITVHAEANAVAAAARNGHSIKGSTCYVTKPVCCQCAALLVQAGVVKIYMPHFSFAAVDWQCNCQTAWELLREAGMKVWFY